MRRLARRQFLIGGAVLVGSATLGSTTAHAAGPPAGTVSPSVTGDPDGVADTYYTALLKNTPIMEANWDPALGAYSRTADTYIGVLGNAVLLRFGQFDPKLAGIDRETLHEHTVRTIEHYAATNYYNGGTEWGRPLFWNATYVVYFGAAANLLWDELGSAAREQVHRLLAGTADYDGTLGTADDPASPGWTTNGLSGGYRATPSWRRWATRGWRSPPRSPTCPTTPARPVGAGGWTPGRRT